MCGGSRARTGNYNDGCDPEHVVEFVTVSSDFYPELRAYYAEEAKEWPARLEGWATVTTRPCCRIACPTWHRRVSKRYPRPPLPVPLAAAGFAASRLASVIARTRRTRARFLRKSVTWECLACRRADDLVPALAAAPGRARTSGIRGCTTARSLRARTRSRWRAG